MHSPPPPLRSKSNSPGGGRRHADHRKANPHKQAVHFITGSPTCRDYQDLGQRRA